MNKSDTIDRGIEVSFKDFKKLCNEITCIYVYPDPKGFVLSISGGYETKDPLGNIKWVNQEYYTIVKSKCYFRFMQGDKCPEDFRFNVTKSIYPFLGLVDELIKSNYKKSIDFNYWPKNSTFGNEWDMETLTIQIESKIGNKYRYHELQIDNAYKNGYTQLFVKFAGAV